MIIGITGKSGSGKTTIAKKLNEENQYTVIEVDKIVHEVLEEEHVKRELAQMYEAKILRGNRIDRKKLGEVVFETKEKTDEYNKYIWDHIKIVLKNRIASSQKNILLEWGLLPLIEEFQRCDITILVECDLETRMQRVIKRDDISKKYFQEREKRSLEYDREKYDIIVTDENIHIIEKLLNELIEKRRKK